MPISDEPKPPQKWGKPRKDGANTSIVPENVAEKAAQPTRIERNERSIQSGNGSRGGRFETAGSTGRRGRN